MADNLSWLLDNLLHKAPGSRSAVLISVDGVKKAYAGVTEDAADRITAAAAAMWSLGRALSNEINKADGVRQVIAELNDSIVFITAASVGSVIAVVADLDTDPSVLSVEMLRLGEQVGVHIASPERSAVLPVAGSR